MKRHLIRAVTGVTLSHSALQDNNFSMNNLQRFVKCHTYFSYSPLYTPMYNIVLLYMIYISIYYYVTYVTHTIYYCI